MIDKLCLSQTLSDDWVLTIENPFDDAETELAVFHVSSTAPNTVARIALLNAAARATASLWLSGMSLQLAINSHNRQEADAMASRVAEFSAALMQKPFAA